MRRFTFRLKTLIDIRERERADRRSEFLQAVAAEEILLEKQKRLLWEQNKLKNDLRAATARGLVDIDQVLGYRRYELILTAQLGNLSQQLNAIREEIERRRAALLEANHALRTLEILQDKQHERFKKELQRREFKELDELATHRVSAEDDLWSEY